MLLVAITGIAGLVIEGSLLRATGRYELDLLLLSMAGGSANGFNQAFERDPGAHIVRTKRRRPLPEGKITVAERPIIGSFSSEPFQIHGFDTI